MWIFRTFCLFYLGFTSLSTICQTYRDGVWVWQGAHCFFTITKTCLYIDSSILKILASQNENFQIIDSDIVHISAQNMDCGYSLELPRRGGSNEYLQPVFLSRNKKNNVYPCKPQFYHIKVGFKGIKII